MLRTDTGTAGFLGMNDDHKESIVRFGFDRALPTGQTQRLLYCEATRMQYKYLGTVSLTVPTRGTQSLHLDHWHGLHLFTCCFALVVGSYVVLLLAPRS